MKRKRSSVRVQRATANGAAEAAFYRLKLEQVLYRLESRGMVTVADVRSIAGFIRAALNEPSAVAAKGWVERFMKMQEALEEKRVDVAASLINQIDEIDSIREAVNESAKVDALRSSSVKAAVSSLSAHHLFSHLKKP